MIYHIGKTAIWFAIVFGLAACPAERFRHEKYVCKSVSFDLESIIVNDTDIGGEVKIIGYHNDRIAIIKAISEDHIEIEASRMMLELDRNDGSVKISRGTRFARLACERSIFTM
ncbi:hypothetical protein N8860_02910 [Alphaproteobacteria bacterium]|nr:hypothetical protein [Alphaproteobacteria bacterium]